MSVRFLQGDCREVLRSLPDGSAHCVVTSPPYWGLRDYGVAGQIGLEQTPADYMAQMVEVFREVRRVLRDDGTLWLNLGDSYATNGGAPSGLKPKDLIGIPWRVAFALQDDGWWLRSDIIWSKPNPMPESVTDRPTSSHEHVFLLAKRERYFFDAEAVREAADESRAGQPMEMSDRRFSVSGRAASRAGNEADPNLGTRPATRNIRNVWTIATQPFSEAHFATYPPELVERCIMAGTSERGCCSACGAPWERQIEKQYVRHENWFGNKQGARHSRGAAGAAYNEPIGRETIGWLPSCQCNAAVVPCVVLDPFGGAGTTGLVADRLQRDAVLIELNADYAEMAERRLRADAGLFAQVAAQ